MLDESAGAVDAMLDAGSWMLDESAGAVDAMLDAGSWMLDEVNCELFFIFPIYVRVRRSAEIDLVFFRAHPGV